MKNYISLLCSLLISISINAQKTESRTLKNFNVLKVSGGISVELLQGDPSADIEIIKGSLDELVTEVRGDVLHIKFEKKGFFNWNNGNKKAHIKLYGSNSIKEIDVSAGAYVGSDLILENERINLSASSGGKIELEVDCEDAVCDASSGGSLKVKGFSKTLRVDASSGGNYAGEKLKSKKVKVGASSGGNATVWATNSIDADASSGGSVKYKGNPSERDIDVGKYSGGSIREF